MELTPQDLLEFSIEVWKQKKCAYVQNIQNINNEEISTKLKNELEEPCKTIYEEAQVSFSDFLKGTAEWETVTVYKYETKDTDEIGKVTFVFYQVHFTTTTNEPHDLRMSICCKKEGYGSRLLTNKKSIIVM